LVFVLVTLFFRPTRRRIQFFGNELQDTLEGGSGIFPGVVPLERNIDDSR
jgi:hypothetical protein